MQDSSCQERIAGLIRDAVFAARDRGDTVYAASEDAAKMIVDQLPELAANGSDETPLIHRLEELLAKWRSDRAEYPDQEFGAKFAFVAVELCERELRAVMRGS